MWFWPELFQYIRKMITTGFDISLVSGPQDIQKLMCTRLRSLLKIKHILYDFHFGFRANYNCRVGLT